RPFARSDFSDSSEAARDKAAKDEEASGTPGATSSSEPRCRSPSADALELSEEAMAVEAAEVAVQVAMETETVEPKADEAAMDTEEQPSPCVAWFTVLLAALLPLLTDALPRDQNGVCIIPHPHQMEQQQAQEDTIYVALGGSGRRPVFRTNKICDNCGARITDRFYFHCSENCDIDFCQECHTRSQDLLHDFVERAADGDQDSMYRRLFWVIDVTERMGWYVLHLCAEDRRRLADELAFEWPTVMFEQLTQ
ncbi:unnamed protein product, partial [Polarella glacialis]